MRGRGWGVVGLGLWLVLVWPAVGLALMPGQILVIANRNVSGSVKLARYYMEKRRVPKVNLLMVRVTDQESCSRVAYNRNVADLVRMYLRELGGRRVIRCLVTMYGMPLKVEAPVKSKNGDGSGDSAKQAEEGGVKTEQAALDSELALVDAGGLWSCRLGAQSAFRRVQRRQVGDSEK
jgi:uncharacterized protein (TIGR03790 family)